MTNSIENFIFNLPNLIAERESLVKFLDKNQFHKDLETKTKASISVDNLFGPNARFKKYEVWKSSAFDSDVVVYIPATDNLEKLSQHDLNSLQKAIDSFEKAQQKELEERWSEEVTESQKTKNERASSKKLEKLEDRLELLEDFIEQSEIGLEVSKHSNKFGVHMSFEIEITGAKIVHVSFLKPKKEGELKRVFQDILSKFQCDLHPELSYDYSNSRYKKSSSVISGIMPLTLKDAQKSQKIKIRKNDIEKMLEQEKEDKSIKTLMYIFFPLLALFLIWYVSG